MSDMTQTIEESLDQETRSQTAPKKKCRRAPGKPRPEARPYKKYDLLNLEGKIRKMKKQCELQKSRLLLLQDKLEKHEKEILLRAQLATQQEE